MSDGDATTADAYGGLVSAFPYAFRRSTSTLFRSYVVVGGLLSALIALMFALALVRLVGTTAAAPGGTLTLSRAFYVVVFLFAVFPVLAPVLLVARRLRRRVSVADAEQAAFGAAGFGYLLLLYLGLAVLAPDSSEPAATGSLAPVLRALNGLPDGAGLLLPLLGAAAIGLLAWRTRS